MYSGPGSGPLLAAAGSWDSLAAELEVTAQSYESVLSGLTNLHWSGPASAAMTATAAPYVGWLHTTAEQTRQAGRKARAAAAAYELAYAMTVPPPAVAANRIQLAALVATNFFGQNTAAIAATEAQYAYYWAQDATAMYGYAASSAAASRLTPFSSPQQTTNPAGLSAQQAAVTQATANAVGASAQAAEGDPSLAAWFTALDPSQLFYDVGILDEIRVIGTSINSSFKIDAIVSGIIGAEKDFGVFAKPAAAAGVTPALTAAPEVSGLAAGLRGATGLGNVSAYLASAETIGRLSVPASWTVPSHSPSFPSLAKGALAGPPGISEPAGPGSGIPGVPGVPGGTVSRPTVVIPRYGRRIIAVMAQPPAAG